MNDLSLRAEEIKNDESKFIIGLDLGNSMACLSYYDFNLNKPQLLDISGGYSRASVPLVVQYVPENDEWIFGEYALLNRPMGNEITFKNIIANMGLGLNYNIGKKNVSLCYVLSLFIKEIIGSIKNINPKAEICGIAASISPYIMDKAKEEIKKAFFMAGFGDLFLGFRDERQCALNYYIQNNKIEKNDKILILDYGERSFRSNLFSLNEIDDKINAECVLSLYDEKSGAGEINKELEKLFKAYYLEGCQKNELSEEEKIEMNIFSYEHKDLFLQRDNKNGIKLYYNFCYPPIKKAVKKEEIQDFILPFKERIEKFLKTYENEACSILTVGGGFDSLWIKKILADIFKGKEIFQYGKEIGAEGACVIACGEMQLLEDFKNIEIFDNQQIKSEIGVLADDEKFIPLSEKNTFWWQEQKEKSFIIDNSEDNNYKLDIYKKNDNEVSKVTEIDLSAFKSDKIKAKRIQLQVKYDSCEDVFIEICDLGFGEIEKSSGFKESFKLS